MAEASVTLKVTPRQFEVLLVAIEDYYGTNKDMVDDPAVKHEDKEGAAQEMFEAAAILRGWGYSHKIS